MTRRTCFLSLMQFVMVASSAAAQIVPPGSVPTQLVTGYGFTEGPLYDGAGGVLFSDMNNADIVRYDIASDTAQIVDPNSGTSNGLIKNAAGNVISADRDRRQISKRSTANIKVVESVLASNWMGTAFNGPNDLVMDADGRHLFHGSRLRTIAALPEAVYYLSPAGALSRCSQTLPRQVRLGPSISVPTASRCRPAARCSMSRLK